MSNKRDQIPQLFWVVRAYNSSGEIIKSVPCYGVTKDDAAMAMGGAMQMLWHCEGVVDVKEFWAGEERQK